MARLYPRYRDAELALYASLNDLHLLDITDGIETPSEALSRVRDRIRTQNRTKHETKHHIRGVMRSLLRKHGAFWKAVDELWRGMDPTSRGANDYLVEYHNVWLCIPLCQLGILQRLDHACSDRKAHRSLRQCHMLIERICHWLHMTNRLMNKVESVSGYELVKD
jgi:hypothetical protein